MKQRKQPPPHNLGSTFGTVIGILIIAGIVALVIAGSHMKSTPSSSDATSVEQTDSGPTADEVRSNAKAECAIDAASGDPIAQSIAQVRSEVEDQFAIVAEDGCDEAYDASP